MWIYGLCLHILWRSFSTNCTRGRRICPCMSKQFHISISHKLFIHLHLVHLCFVYLSLMWWWALLKGQRFCVAREMSSQVKGYKHNLWTSSNTEMNPNDFIVWQLIHLWKAGIRIGGIIIPEYYFFIPKIPLLMLCAAF